VKWLFLSKASKYSGPVPTNSTANTNDLNEVAAKCSVSPSGGHSKSDDLPEQANGDTRLGHSLDGMRQKVSCYVHFYSSIVYVK